MRILVIGGGIAGLAAADEALGLGHEVTLVECEPTVGGLLRTDRRDGFCFDRGGHRFITALPWVLERVRAKLGDRLLRRTRRSLIFLDGTTVEYPLQVGDLIRQLGWIRNTRALGSYLLRQLRPAPDQSHLEGWLRLRFGDYLYNTIFAGYTHKLWGRPAREISAEWAPQRISIPSLRSYLMELLRPSKRPPRTYAREFLYPRTGIGEIPEAWVRDILAAGGVVSTGARVLALRRERDGWQARIEISPEEHRTSAPGTISQQFDGVVATQPVDRLLDILQGEAPIPSPRLEYRGLRFLNIALSQPVPLDATWVYQPDPKSPFTRLQIPAARSPEMVPEGRGSVQLEAPIGGGPVEQQDRVALALEFLERLGAGNSQVLFHFERSEPHAYPMYLDGSRQRAAAARSQLQSLPGLELAGRQGGFNYIFLDRALAEGVNAVRRLCSLDELVVEKPGRLGRPIPVEAESCL